MTNKVTFIAAKNWLNVFNTFNSIDISLPRGYIFKLGV